MLCTSLIVYCCNLTGFSFCVPLLSFSSLISDSGLPTSNMAAVWRRSHSSQAARGRRRTSGRVSADSRLTGTGTAARARCWPGLERGANMAASSGSL
ncbi:hypothetical protein FKM82_006893 [Ascaphus truei]